MLGRVHDNLLLNLLVLWLANRSNTPSAKFKKLASSGGADFAIGECVSATPDDNDVCEVEWDSPRPLSGNILRTYVLSNCA